MKLTFLGTSHGVPGPKRFCSSTMLSVGEDVYLIDGGAPVADLLMRRGVEFRRIKAIFTTHLHSDHTLGLLPLLDVCSWCSWFQDVSYDVFLTEQVGIDAFKQVILATDKKLDENRIRMKLTKECKIYEDENLCVTATPTIHNHNGLYPAFSLIIDVKKENKRVVFTGDMHYGDACDFPILAKDEPSDVIVCEMAHFSHEVIMPILEKCPTKRVFINHVWFDYEKNMAAIEHAEKHETMPFPIHAVEDGEEFEI